MPKVKEVLDYFFDQVILQRDTLNIVTPLKTYNLKPKTFEIVPKEKIKKQVIGILKKDIRLGNAEYINLIKELEICALNGNVQGYALALAQLAQLRHIDQKNLEAFANSLKAKKTQKHVFLFYQQESVPELVLSASGGFFSEADRMVSKGATFLSAPLFSEINISFDTDLIKKAFSDSSISVHFLYITKALRDRIDVSNMGSLKGMKFIEISNDIFQAFRQTSSATGGLTDSTANISSAFKQAAKASDNYYLLYYSPKKYNADGKFRNIKVKINNRNLRITHRAGYFAN
jgi:hypothetical protein